MQILPEPQVASETKTVFPTALWKARGVEKEDVPPGRLADVRNPEPGLDLKLLPPDLSLYLSRLRKLAACLAFVSDASLTAELLCQVFPSHLELLGLHILPPSSFGQS